MPTTTTTFYNHQQQDTVGQRSLHSAVPIWEIANKAVFSSSSNSSIDDSGATIDNISDNSPTPAEYQDSSCDLWAAPAPLPSPTPDLSRSSNNYCGDADSSLIESINDNTTLYSFSPI